MQAAGLSGRAALTRTLAGFIEVTVDVVLAVSDSECVSLAGHLSRTSPLARPVVGQVARSRSLYPEVQPLRVGPGLGSRTDSAPVRPLCRDALQHSGDEDPGSWRDRRCGRAAEYIIGGAAAGLGIPRAGGYGAHRQEVRGEHRGQAPGGVGCHRRWICTRLCIQVVVVFPNFIGLIVFGNHDPPPCPGQFPAGHYRQPSTL
jgi:hypothetical protein